MINNIIMEEGDPELAPPKPNVQPSVYYKYTDMGAEWEDPDALQKAKKKSNRPGTSKWPITAKKGDIVSMVETMTNVQNVEKKEREAKRKKLNFPKAKGIIKS